MAFCITSRISLLLLAAGEVYAWTDDSAQCDASEEPRLSDSRHEMVLLQSKPVRRSRVEDSGPVDDESSSHEMERKGDSVAFVSGKDEAHNTLFGDEVCGTRPLFPQLQFELEVYRKLGLVTSQYAQCRVPNIRAMVVDIPFGNSFTSSADALYEELDAIMAKNWESLPERRTLIAKGLVGLFCAAALMTIGSFALSMYAAKMNKKDQDDLSLIQTSWKLSAMQWMGNNLGFLEPLIGRFGWPEVPNVKLADVSPDGHAEAYLEFRKAWQEEVKASGLENADLLSTVKRLVGTRVMLWMLFTAGIAALLELAAMTIVLDMLLNYLHLARAARMQDKTLSLDMLRPTIMFIGSGFCIPMAARTFSNMAALCDTFHTNRLTAGLLAVVYEKSQHLPFSKTEDPKKDAVQAMQILTNDIRRMWVGALTNYTHLIVSPACVLVLLMYWIVNVGQPAAFGLVCTIWMGLLYFPIKNQVKRGHQRWGQLANSRVDLTKEALSNVRTVKATLWSIPLSDRINALREEELQTRFRFSMVQSLLDIPFNLFPFALVVLSLFFCFASNGKVQSQDIFVCMQVLSGLTYCLPGIARSLQSMVSLLNASRRVQCFLREPEKPLALLNRPARDFESANAPHVRLRGNFAVGEGQRPVLQDINLQVQRGELVAVVGEVASGKSALLSAIMGDLPGCDGDSSVEAPKNAIYCAQEPWVVDGTLKENVTLGEKDNTDQERLYNALDSARLLKDVIIPGEPRKEKTKEATSRAVVRADAADGYDLAEKEDQPKFLFPYFWVWNLLAVFVFVMSAANVKWKTTRPALGLLIAAIQGLLHWSVLEFPIQTVATLMTTVRKLRKADGTKLTICMNYNLLATSQADVDECMHNMLEAYMLNLGENISTCLVSATNDPNLQQYELQVRNDHRAKVYKELFRSGLAWAGFGEGGGGNPRTHLWKKYEHIEKNLFVQQHLGPICERYAQEYMVLHRTSRVLRKCGQYQDLILLSAGEDMAFTYCDTELYGRAARKYGEPLFKASEDTDNMRARQFDYTLVLDGDTRVPEGFVSDVLEFAAAYPEKAIVQPAIKMDIGPEDSIFMHLEAMRQRVYEPMNSTITTLLGKSSFFGKGLIQNAAYAKYCLGTREHLIEAVPINVLSHDTFEAAVASPLYVHSLYLLEAPCHNYITWDIRERRWNLGEMLLAGYFWPNGVGKPIERLQHLLQGEKYNQIKVRTETKMDRVTSYFAFSALRQMVLKPMLLAYIVVMHFVTMRWKWAPLVTVMFCIIIFPKFATCTRHNWKAVLLETGASFLQFTPEAIVGTIRVLSAVKAHLAGAATWVPQRSVEEESKVSNPFVFSLRYLWYYSVFAMVWGLRVGFWASAVGPEAMFVITILGTLFMLPLYVGITSLPANSLRHLTGGGKEIVSEIKEEEAGGGVADPSEAALQAFRVRFASVRMRKGGEGEPQQEAAPQRNENALHVFHASALKVGLRGVGLSGSERVRLALARAAYSRRSNLVLIDDPFGHVDAPTGKEIFHKLIRGPLMLGRTRIVVMQPYTDYLEYFDQVIMLSEGRVVLKGKPLDVLATREFQELMAKMARETSIEDLQVSKPQVTGEEGSPLKLGCACEGTGTVIEETQDLPQWDKVWNAVQTGGLWRLSIAMVSSILLRITIQGQMILLGRWADQAQAHEQVGSNYYVLMTLIVVVLSVCQVIQSYFMQAFNGSVSREVFRRAWKGVLKAPVEGFWNGQPSGRIVGRLTSDILNVDSTLASSLVSMACIAIDIVVQQVYCTVVMSIWLILPTYFVMGLFCRFFCNTAMHLQLVAALGLSRCQEEQVELKASRLSVQAFQYENKMVARYCAHAGLVVMPESLSSHLKTWTVSRITFCLCFQCTVCVLIGILRPEMIGVGTLAIIITSTFLIVQQLRRFVDALVDTIALFISLQRLSEYSDIPQDAPDQLAGDEQRRNQLVSNGVEVRIEGLHFGYGETGPAVLTNINFDIQPKTKAVLAGGPGSGKSTVLYCILRILDQRSGRVMLSGMNTRNLGILTLRSVIGLVAQEPIIFQGSVRFNIDPFNQYSDERIWVAIQCAQLLPTARKFTGGLDHIFSEEGSNLSHGQKQLFNLARAVCQQPPLLLLDECCTSLDPRTQDAVQDTIMLNFPNSTVIAATRRMDEIKNFQHMVLLEKGQVVRQGPVSRLLPGGAGATPAGAARAGADGP